MVSEGTCIILILSNFLSDFSSDCVRFDRGRYHCIASLGAMPVGNCAAEFYQTGMGKEKGWARWKNRGEREAGYGHCLRY